tara:strand:+ start:2705 stop:3733 length:1029 start_codon:yes stop_codon:yes gene_type:complete
MASTNQKNIFIDTEQYHDSTNSVQLLFPSQTLVVPQGYGMKLSLQQFFMKKCFYNINSYNSEFYIYNKPNKTYKKVNLIHGDYHKFGIDATTDYSLCKNISDALGALSPPLNLSYVKYDENTRKIKIDSSDLDDNNYIVFLQVPPERQKIQPVNVTDNGFFSDIAEIMGGVANQQDPSTLPNGDPVPAFDISLSVSTSFYPASLFSMECLRININLGNTNLQTPNMEANSSSSVCVPTQTFATIPLEKGAENIQSKSLIVYQDSGDEMFSLKLQQSHIDNATLSIVDNKGRPLEEVNANQYKNGMLSYNMVIRFEIIEEPAVTNPSNFPSNNRTGNLLPALK